jgi:hypothetical protein
MGRASLPKVTLPGDFTGEEGMRLRVAIVVACFAIGCQVPTQIVPLHLRSGTRVFVDGSEVPAGAESVELRSDQPHVVHLERAGHYPQQLVLATRQTENGPHLEPEEIRVRLEPMVPTERKIRIESAE